MNRILISLLAVGAMALSAAAGDLRQLVTVPANGSNVTVAAFTGLPVRGNATAHIDHIAVGASASATNITISVVSAGAGYTNTIAVYGPVAFTASTTYQTTSKFVVGANDSILVSFTGATNAVATQVYIGMQGY